MDLPHLIPIWPNECEGFTPKETLSIISKLKTALRKERKRALLGHWAYSLNRHKALLEALKGEEEKLDKQLRKNLNKKVIHR